MRIAWDLGKDVTYEILIANLGGYDVVKGAALNYRNSGDSLTAEKFERAGLEHRRKHGIFKVEDYVIDKISGQFFQIIEIDGDQFVNQYRFWCKLVWMRHATDAEIEAGKRLEVGDA